MLVLEYLSRVLKSMSRLPDFKFHPICKHVQLTHLAFVDNLMIFCKGDVKFVSRVNEVLNHFSAVSGLTANMDKSNIFMAGVDDATKTALLHNTGFSQGTFPIRYLGLHLSPKKWSKLDCNMLVDKSFFLFYSQFTTFGGVIFILLQSMVKVVDGKCRTFLWGGDEEKRKINFVAWESVCVPKCNGGINIKRCRIWNLAFVGKLLC